MWIINLIKSIAQYRRFIILNTAIVTILAILVTFILPKEYKARATILPPESQSGIGFSGLGNLSVAQVAQAVTNFSLPVLATPSDLYASMLKSETILIAIVDSLDLRSIYETKTRWSAMSALKNNTIITVESDGIISIEAVARDSVLAAQIANLMVRELNRLNIDIQKRKGSQHVDFLSQRLEETEEDLERALDRLREFQKENMAISLELQSAALIDNLAQQKARLTTAEIELEIMRKNLNPGHPDLVTQQQRVNEIKEKLREIERGARTGADSVISALNIPLTEIPDLSLQFSVLKRNVKIQEVIYELLAQQLEMSRLQESRDTPMISVLDSARPPSRHFKPRRVVIVFVAFVLSFMFSVFAATVHQRWSTADAAQDSVIKDLRGTIRQIVRKPLG